MRWTKSELENLCDQELGNLFNEAGSVLYSGESTLKKGDFYFLGFNPGGTPNDKDLIKHSIVLQGDRNAFLDQNWGNDAARYGEGEAPLQKRVDHLLRALGASTREVCATNLIFVRSQGEDGLANPRKLTAQCWKVHVKLIEVVDPKVILCHGRQAFDFVGEQCDAHSMESFHAEHGKWQCRAATTSDGRLLLGVPHLSRYDPTMRVNVLARLRKLVGNAGVRPLAGTA